MSVGVGLVGIRDDEEVARVCLAVRGCDGSLVRFACGGTRNPMGKGGTFIIGVDFGVFTEVGASFWRFAAGSTGSSGSNSHIIFGGPWTKTEEWVRAGVG